MVTIPVLKTRSGHSLMEMVVAMGLSILLISIVYFLWDYINIHVANQSTIAVLRKENHRILQLVSTQIQNSSTILEWNWKSIRFVSDKTEDTIFYEFDQDTLRLNQIPVTILLKRCTVSEFKLEDLSEDPLSNSKHIFLKLTLALHHESGAADTSIRTIRARRALMEMRNDDFY